MTVPHLTTALTGPLLAERDALAAEVERLREELKGVEQKESTTPD